MRVAFFGGSFDPPHRGHLAIAHAAAQHLALDRILLAPTGLQPFKRGGAEAGFSDRLAMVQLLCEFDPALLRASAIDSPHPNGSLNYTLDALTTLHAELPAAELFAIIGADNLLELPHWHGFPQLLEVAQWVTVSRPGYEPSAALPNALERARQQGRLHLLTGVDLPIASRELRVQLRLGHSEGDATRDAIPPAILRYIARHNLYRA